MANKLIRYEHTKIRLKERYDIDINLNDYILMCKIADDGLIDKTKSKNRDYRFIYFKGNYISVGYNKKYKLINTALYLNNRLKKYRNGKI